MPFGEYEDFEDCVSKNQDKENPEGFCAWLHWFITGQWPSEAKVERGKRLLRLNIEQVASLCPPCAEKLKELGVEFISLSVRQMPEQLLQGLCDKFSEPGFFSECMESSLGDFEPSEKEAFCAWLHYECLGTWPAERLARGQIRKREYRKFDVEQKIKGRVVEGHAAVFGDIADMGVYKETIQPGAFKETLTKDDIRALINHDSNLVLGRTKSGTLELVEDDRGLFFSINLPDTQYANDLLTLIERGDVNQCSFGFELEDEEWREEGKLRVIKKVKLFDVSICTFPAYEATSVGIASRSENERNALQAERRELWQRLNKIRRGKNGL